MAVGIAGEPTYEQISFRICCLSARMLSDVGPPAGVLQMIVRIFTPRSASASKQSVGHACGGPKLWTRIDAPSGMSATAARAVAQTRLVAMAGPRSVGRG